MVNFAFNTNLDRKIFLMEPNSITSSILKIPKSENFLMNSPEIGVFLCIYDLCEKTVIKIIFVSGCYVHLLPLKW